MITETRKALCFVLALSPLMASAADYVPQSWEVPDAMHAFFTTAHDATPDDPAAIVADARDACIDAGAASALQATAPQQLADATDACIDASVRAAPTPLYARLHW